MKRKPPSPTSGSLRVAEEGDLMRLCGWRSSDGDLRRGFQC